MVRKPHGLGSSRFDRHYSGNRCFFLFLWVLRCFSSPRTRHPCGWWQIFNLPGCPIRTCADQFLFADPRAFSQLTTSFIGIGSLGILRSLFVSFSWILSFLWNCSLTSSNSKKLEFLLSDLISFLFLYLFVSFNIVNELCRFLKRAAKIHTFSKPANLFLIFFDFTRQTNTI